MALCPICYSELGLWSDDPILCTPTLSTEEYKGYTIIKPNHIISIQNLCNIAEIEAGLTPSIWTLVDNTNLYQVLKPCIKELRISIENVLTAVGKTKYDLFNYDKDGNYMGTSQTEWHDPDLDDKIYQIKAIHIEDLRHPIPVPIPVYMDLQLWYASWDSGVLPFPLPSGSYFEMLDRIILYNPGITVPASVIRLKIWNGFPPLDRAINVNIPIIPSGMYCTLDVYWAQDPIYGSTTFDTKIVSLPFGSILHFWGTYTCSILLGVITNLSYSYPNPPVVEWTRIWPVYPVVIYPNEPV